MGNSATQEQKDAFLSVAAEKGETVKVDKLLKEGANPNMGLADGDRKKRTSLHRAAKTKNNVDVLTKLLTYIRDVDATDDEGNTALHLAAGYYNNAAVVQTLLHAKPNCRVQNSKGETALHSAILNGSDWKVVELLLLGDSDPNIADFEGNTPLHLCVGKKGSDDMVPGILLRFGANPNLKNEEGQTPLHVASKAGNKVVLLLLKFHAKVRLRDKENKKPADLAELEEIKRILEFEERSLEERTTRTGGMNGYASYPAEMPYKNHYEGVEKGVYDLHHNNAYPSNGYVTPGGKSTHFWAGDVGEWRAFGGEGIIHLPNKSDLVVPPQAIPQGTTFKLSIKPSLEKDSNNVPEFDFDLYDFELDIKVDLPGASFVSPWMKNDSSSIRILPSNTSPLAFTGFCADGQNRWTSCREVACQRNGAVALQFNLARKKGESLAYKVPIPNRRSTTEMFMRSPRRGLLAPTTNKQNGVLMEEYNSSQPQNSGTESSLSSEEEEEALEHLDNSTKIKCSGSSSSVKDELRSSFSSTSTEEDCQEADKTSPASNQFDQIQVVVGIKDENVKEKSKKLKTPALEAIGEFLRNDPELSDHECSSSSDESGSGNIVESKHKESVMDTSTPTFVSEADFVEVNEPIMAKKSDDVLSRDRGSSRKIYERNEVLENLASGYLQLSDDTKEKIDVEDRDIVSLSSSSEDEKETTTNTHSDDSSSPHYESGYVSFQYPDIQIGGSSIKHREFREIKKDVKNSNDDVDELQIIDRKEQEKDSSSSQDDESTNDVNKHKKDDHPLKGGALGGDNFPGDYLIPPVIAYEPSDDEEGHGSSSSSDDETMTMKTSTDVTSADANVAEKLKVESSYDANSDDYVIADHMIGDLDYRKSDILIGRNEDDDLIEITNQEYDPEDDSLLLQGSLHEESRYQHPIDPALATICEDTEEADKEKFHSRSSNRSRSSSSSSSNESKSDKEFRQEKLI